MGCVDYLGSTTGNGGSKAGHGALLPLCAHRDVGPKEARRRLDGGDAADGLLEGGEPHAARQDDVVHGDALLHHPVGQPVKR